MPRPAHLESEPTVAAPAAAARGAVESVRWDGGAPVVIDQRELPARLVDRRLASVDAVVEAIQTLAVRGAPAIGIAGAYGVVVGLDEAAPRSREDALAVLDALAARIGAARPTAVNLSVAVRRVHEAAVYAARHGPPEAPLSWIREAALTAARAIHDEDRAACERIGQAGRDLLRGKRRILTHCNTGRLATGGDGTALGVIYAMHAAGELDEVIACEARPLLQGGRLTAWELTMSGVPNRLIVDGAAGLAMQRGLVEAVVVGCDRVAANGDTANKIGTFGLAVLARWHGIPFHVAGPMTSFDLATSRGADIVIEERAADEVRGFGGRAVALADAGAWNPAFDVTPADLIDAFITDDGVLRPPYTETIARALGRRAAAPPTQETPPSEAVASLAQAARR